MTDVSLEIWNAPKSSVIAFTGHAPRRISAARRLRLADESAARSSGVGTMIWDEPSRARRR